MKTYSGKRNHGSETGRLPPTIEISSSWGFSRWLPVKWNGLPAANYFIIVTLALQKNITISMGRAHLFRIEAQESIKDNTFRGDEVVQLSPTYTSLHTKYPY